MFQSDHVIQLTDVLQPQPLNQTVTHDRGLTFANDANV